jgi:hypothetical protein
MALIVLVVDLAVLFSDLREIVNVSFFVLREEDRRCLSIL